MFDLDSDGILNTQEMKNMVDGLLEVYKQYDDVCITFFHPQLSSS